MLGRKAVLASRGPEVVARKQRASTKLSQVGAAGEARAPADFPTEEMVTSLLGDGHVI